MDASLAQARQRLRDAIDLWAIEELVRLHEAANRAHRSIGQQVRFARARLLKGIPE